MLTVTLKKQLKFLNGNTFLRQIQQSIEKKIHVIAITCVRLEQPGYNTFKKTCRGPMTTQERIEKKTFNLNQCFSTCLYSQKMYVCDRLLEIKLNATSQMESAKFHLLWNLSLLRNLLGFMCTALIFVNPRARNKMECDQWIAVSTKLERYDR